MVSLSPLPHLNLHGSGAESPDLPPTFLPLSLMDQLALSAEGETSSSKKWSSDHAEMMPPKRARLHPCSSSPLPEAEQVSRQQQEEEDCRLALLLQKEMDQEERRAVNRRKGSSDAYPLRLSRQESSSSSTSRKTTSLSSTQKASAPKTSSPETSSRSPSSPRLGRGRKQATLTQMFSSSRS